MVDVDRAILGKVQDDANKTTRWAFVYSRCLRGSRDGSEFVDPFEYIEFDSYACS